MVVAQRGLAQWALAAVLAGSVAGCAADPRSAADCAFVASSVQAASDLGTALDAPATGDCRSPAPAGIDPAARSGAPLAPPDIDPKPFAPSG